MADGGRGAAAAGSRGAGRQEAGVQTVVPLSDTPMVTRLRGVFTLRGSFVQTKKENYFDVRREREGGNTSSSPFIGFLQL